MRPEEKNKIVATEKVVKANPKRNRSTFHFTEDQVTNKNIYTPRYIRADAGFFVDGTSKGINGSGNFIGGTIAGASDYGTLIRSNANDNVTGHTEWQDDYQVRLGAGADLRLYHNGSQSYIDNQIDINITNI